MIQKGEFVNLAPHDSIEKLKLIERIEKAEKAVEQDSIKRNQKRGKVKRHQKLKRKLRHPGFGKPWESDCRWFRVEFAYFESETEDEDNFQSPHWVSCRKFKGEERRFLAAHAKDYQQRDMLDRETIESIYVCLYIANFLCQIAYGEKYNCHVHTRLPPDFDDKINQAFIYPAPSKHNDSIREPLYLLRIKQSMCQAIPSGIAASLRNSICHEY